MPKNMLIVKFDEKKVNNLNKGKVSCEKRNQTKRCKYCFSCSYVNLNYTVLEKHCMIVRMLALLHSHCRLGFLHLCLIKLMEHKLNALKTI